MRCSVMSNIWIRSQVEDMTDPDKVHTDPTVDRDITLYVHIPLACTQ